MTNSQLYVWKNRKKGKCVDRETKEGDLL